MEPLAIALVLSVGMCVRFYWRMRTAEKRASHLAADNAFKDRQIENQRATIADLVSEVARKEQLRKDAFALYREQLDEVAFLRGGGAAE
jgi:hypothetical protein